MGEWNTAESYIEYDITIEYLFKLIEMPVLYLFLDKIAKILTYCTPF